MGLFLKHPLGTYQSAAVSGEGNSDHSLWVWGEGGDGLKTVRPNRQQMAAGKWEGFTQNSAKLPFFLMQWQPLVSRGLVTYRLFCWLWRLLFAGRSNIWFYVSRLDFFSPIPLAFCFPLCYLPLLKLKGLRNSCCCPWDVEHFYWQQDFKCNSPVIVSCSVWLFC